MAELVQTTYANSLFEVAVENKAEDKIFEELSALRPVFMENREFIKILSAPVVGKDIKHKMLTDTFEGSLCVYTANFLRLLVDNERFSYVISVIDEYKRLYDAHNGIIEVTAITAAALNDTLKQRLTEKLNLVTNKNVRLKNIVDESILGGVKLRFDNTEIDSSVKSRLDELKGTIKNITM